MAYRFQVNQVSCINCGICMDLCPVRCLDMTRPAGDGELGGMASRQSPIPGASAERSWMMLAPVQVDQCIGCQVCAQECPTNAITIASGAKSVSYARRGPVTHLPPEGGWQPLDAYTRAMPGEPGEVPWGDNHAWRVAERTAVWQTWRSWLGERQEDLRAPCQAACPVGTNAGLYVSLIAQGQFDEALRVAAEPNPFPAICGRVCTAPCEAACRRGEFDAPIAIRDLKRFVSDHAGPRERPVRAPRHHFKERVGIVGAGPTGLSAAYYLARRGYAVTIIDAMPVPGGMMSIGIPEYRLPRTELQRDFVGIQALGVEFRLNTAVGRDVTLDELRRDYDAVLLAVGAQRSQRLRIPGETELQRVMPATSFLKDYNLDPNTRLPGSVVVVGGGSTAMDAARSALRAGASEVRVLYRRTQVEMPAQKEEVRAAIAEGIQIEELVVPLELNGDGGRVRTVSCQRMTPVQPDDRGRNQLVPIADSQFDLPVDHVLVAIGEAPDPSFLPEGTSVEVSAWGGLLVNSETLATGADGIFAAGDVTLGPTDIIHAAAHGRRASRAIHAYLRGFDVHRVAELPDDETETASTLPLGGRFDLDLRPTPRAEMPLRSSATPDRTAEFELGLTEEEARHEASRCLRCDLAYLCPSIPHTGRIAPVATHAVP